jgi:hypothetical protein
MELGKVLEDLMSNQPLFQVTNHLNIADTIL